MPKAVIDTNLLVRALMRKTPISPLIGGIRNHKFVLVASRASLDELFEVLARPKFAKYFSRDEIADLQELIIERAELVIPQLSIELCRDPKDNFLIEAAIAGQSDYLVTADLDLLELRDYILQQYGVLILGTAEFIELID
ncbi:MAG: putative toxin-antitoxin system toxin component, PIN family [Anaerolineae bacterium]|nr:putative toxin-antitoxin system toxin component, PIN family [Anaerolineae bacterium]